MIIKKQKCWQHKSFAAHKETKYLSLNDIAFPRT